MTGPLTGLRVVEIGHHIPAPYAAMLLADWGATVTKIEPPGGEAGRNHPAFPLFNRGKELRALDLKTPAGQAAARDLIRSTDVLIENFRPGVLDRLGLSPADLRRENPRLITVSITGYGSSGPDRDRPGWDSLVAARAGIPDDQGVGGRPEWVTQPVSSYAAALLAVQGALAALLARHRTGRGRHVEVSLLGAALAVQTHSLVEGEGFSREPNPTPLGSKALYRLYACADGRWFFLACGNPVFVFKLAQAIDYPDLLLRPEFANAPWLIDPEPQAELAAHLAATFAGRPRDEWLQVLAEHDVPAAPIQTTLDYFDDPQARHVGAVRDGDAPGIGRVRWLGDLVHFESGPASAAAVPAGTDSGEDGAPLAGLRVLDLSGYIAGAFGPRLLADLGADVIKVEALDGDPFRLLAGGFLAWNRGKRGLALDLKKPGARNLVRRLMAGADVLVENFRPGVAKRLGVDPESARAINPLLIYCSVPGYGLTGPDAARPAFDPLLQARSGAMARQGGPGQPPVFLRAAISDYGAAILAANGILAALYERATQGTAGRVDTSLANSCVALQATDFIDYAGRPARPDGGPDRLGPAALNRLYQAADGWLHLTCPDPNAAAVTAHVLSERQPDPPPGSAWERGLTERAPYLEAWLGAVFGSAPVGHWTATFAGTPAGVEAARSLNDAVQDPAVVALGAFVEHRHPEHGPIRQIGPVIRFSGAAVPAGRPAPALGEHSADILRGIGCTDEEIAALRDERVVR